MKKFVVTNLWWVTFLLAIMLLAIHSFKLASISVDSTSILLLLIILISPFIASIRKIKYGDFEAEIDSKEVQKIKSEVENISDSNSAEQETRPEIYAATDSIRELAKSDPVIALAKIRIELEKVLNRLAKFSGIEVKRPVLGLLVRSLSNYEILTPNLAKSLSDVISICNRAIHGESISEDSANTIVSLGIDLLEEIYWSIQEQISSGSIVSESTISNAESDSYYSNRRYRLTTVIPLIENPKKIVRELNQEQLDEFLEGYHEYAEFMVELIEIPNKG